MQQDLLAMAENKKMDILDRLHNAKTHQTTDDFNAAIECIERLRAGIEKSIQELVAMEEPNATVRWVKTNVICLLKDALSGENVI